MRWEGATCERTGGDPKEERGSEGGREMFVFPPSAVGVGTLPWSYVSSEHAGKGNEEPRRVGKEGGRPVLELSSTSSASPSPMAGQAL